MNAVDMADVMEIMKNPQTERERLLAEYSKAVDTFDVDMDELIDAASEIRWKIDDAESLARMLEEKLESMKGEKLESMKGEK